MPRQQRRHRASRTSRWSHGSPAWCSRSTCAAASAPSRAEPRNSTRSSSMALRRSGTPCSSRRSRKSVESIPRFAAFSYAPCSGRRRAAGNTDYATSVAAPASNVRGGKLGYVPAQHNASAPRNEAGAAGKGLQSLGETRAPAAPGGPPRCQKKRQGAA